MRLYIAFFIVFTNIFVIVVPSLFGQDPHFSMPDMANPYYNVSDVGRIAKESSITLIYRDQWNAAGAPFKTRFAFFQQNLKKFGLGVHLWQADVLGGGIRHLSIQLTGAYHKQFGPHTLSVGIRAGNFQKSFEPDELSFDSQYVPGQGFDPSLPSGEIFPLNRVSVADFATGASYHFQAKSRDPLQSFQVGVNISHLSRPTISFNNDLFDPDAKLELKYIITSRAYVQQTENLLFIPQLLFERQGNHSELLLGVNMQMAYQSGWDLGLGLSYRFQKSLIPLLYIQNHRFKLGISYDFTQSIFRQATQGRGALEIGLKYSFRAKPPVEKKPRSQKRYTNKDRDGDGIVDSKDRCPDVAGGSLFDGCLDSDGDGLADPDDHCPQVPGIVSKQGCPNADRDGDGILDEDDLCPQTPGIPIFRGCPDTDQDGIPDHQDMCPDRFGPKLRQGCPNSDIDADGDGTPDKIDMCPMVAGVAFLKGCPDSDGDGMSDFEDQCPFLFGEAANLGCPQNAFDADGDGLKNQSDKCPFIPGLRQFQGCPDTDKDGIQDLEDECPLIPGPLERKGCPEQNLYSSQPNVDDSRLIPSFGPVEFDTDQAIIKPQYYEMLISCATYLKQHPKKVIQLGGHTDYEGGAAYNMVLSTNRSLAVKNFLISHGIHPSKVLTASYGENLPKADNDSFRGRARNRRVEMVILNM